MTTRKPEPDYMPLVEAAQAFADELRSYTLLSQSFQRAPMTSAKHLERITETLNQISASEQRLGERGQDLARAVASARVEQEEVARATLARIPAVKERTEKLGKLVARFDELGQEVRALNDAATTIRQSSDRDPAEAIADETERKRELSANMHSLALRAQELTTSARELEFEEMATRAHALYQQLMSAHKKMELATV